MIFTLIKENIEPNDPLLCEFVVANGISVECDTKVFILLQGIEAFLFNIWRRLPEKERESVSEKGKEKEWWFSCSVIKFNWRLNKVMHIHMGIIELVFDFFHQT